jgi:flagellar hook-basal body complex protein FliE
MTMDFIAPLAPIREPALAPLAAPPALDGAAPAASFGDLVSAGLREVGNQLQTSQADLQRLATGDVENLHQIMIRMEEARLSFQLMLQVRNRLLESYQEVMRMQV